MSFLELVEEIARRTKLKPYRVRLALTTMGKVVREKVEAGESVKVLRFGTFYPVENTRKDTFGKKPRRTRLVRFRQPRSK